MNIAESFANFLETQTGAVLGTDLFINAAPSSNDVPDTLWWIVSTGGSPTTGAVSGESLKAYTIEVYYRSRNYKQVQDALQALEITLNCSECVELDSFDTVRVRASVLSIDTDLDSEERKVGLLQADLTVYERCSDVS